MEENKVALTEEEKAEKKRKSNNRIFGLLVGIAVILGGLFIYEIVDLIVKSLN